MAWHQIGDQAIIWTNADPIHWRIYEALGNDELMAASILGICECEWIYWA